jgi:mono/diheme cytochrome c family protein
MLSTVTRTGLARKLVAAASLVALTAATGFGLLGQATADPISVTPAVHTSATLSSATPADRQRMLTQFCGGCHNDKAKTAGMSIMPLKADNIEAHTATWEKILRRVSLGEMPPRGMKRPSKEEIADFTGWLEASLDKMGAALSGQFYQHCHGCQRQSSEQTQSKRKQRAGAGDRAIHRLTA